MRPDEFEGRMRALEVFHRLRLPPGAWVILLPRWQRRGTGLYWERYERVGYNPKRDQEVVTTRRRIKVDPELPAGEEYADFIRQLMEAPHAPTGLAGPP